MPARWDAKTGAGIAWKVPVPASGFNSPIVWGDRVFLSGGDAKKREVVCLDCKTGQMLWRQAVASPGRRGRRPQVPESTGYAAATMATDGRRVYVIFANGDCAAFTLEGKLVWSKSFGALKNPLWPRDLPGHLARPADRPTRPGGERRREIEALRAGWAHGPGRLAAPAQGGELLGDAHRH